MPTSNRGSPRAATTASSSPDATATFDREILDGERYDAEAMHRTALARLHGEFANAATTDEIRAE